jgi:ankyrin repeat protein
MTPLHCAAMDGNKEMVALLLELGANVKAKGQVNSLRNAFTLLRIDNSGNRIFRLELWLQ